MSRTVTTRNDGDRPGGRGPGSGRGPGGESGTRLVGRPKQRPNRARKFEAMGQLGLGFSVEEMTRIPESDWVPPDLSSLPDRLFGDIGFDTETKDEGLGAKKRIGVKQGPGWAWRGGGHVAGYSITADNFSGYLPVGHEGGGNLDPDGVRRWLNHVLGDETQPKIFANALYDIPWAANDGVEIKGPVVDIQLVEPLIDEYRFDYSLDAIAFDRTGMRKEETHLTEAARAYGYDTKGELWRLPAKHVGRYATFDSVLPRETWKAQKLIVEREGLGPIVQLEHDLIPMYIDMRRRGVRVDLDKVDQLRGRFRKEVEVEVARIRNGTGIYVDIWSADSVAKVLDWAGIRYGTTDKSGAPSITNDLLDNTDHWVARAIRRARERDKLIGTFLEGQILKQAHDSGNGWRVHGTIHPLKSGDEDERHGTVSGRLSMSGPNLQFIPARTEEGKLIREAFLAEYGEQWHSIDVNQQEVRLLVHFAVKACKAPIARDLKRRLESAIEAQRKYIEDPTLNYHKFVAAITELPYKAAKILNFAIIYGRGIRETAESMGQSYDETKALFDQHAEKMPFAKAMSEMTQSTVRERGFLRTLLGRRQRFPLWEPADWDRRDGKMYPLEKARETWPRMKLVRARIHKALNSLIQPSAADQTKKSMLEVWRAGYGRHVLVQVHDELDVSAPDRRIPERIAEIMRDAVKLEVPVIVDVDSGENWGKAT